MKEKPIKPLTSRQYLNEYDGAICPLCLSEDIEADSVDMDGSIGTSAVRCNTCGSSWTDIWVIKGYSDLNIYCDKIAFAEIQEKAKKILRITKV